MQVVGCLEKEVGSVLPKVTFELTILDKRL